MLAAICLKACLNALDGGKHQRCVYRHVYSVTTNFLPIFTAQKLARETKTIPKNAPGCLFRQSKISDILIFVQPFFNIFVCLDVEGTDQKKMSSLDVDNSSEVVVMSRFDRRSA